MLRALFNKSWEQHLIKQQLYGYLPSISLTIKVGQARQLIIEIILISCCQCFDQILYSSTTNNYIQTNSKIYRNFAIIYYLPALRYLVGARTRFVECSEKIDLLVWNFWMLIIILLKISIFIGWLSIFFYLVWMGFKAYQQL